MPERVASVRDRLAAADAELADIEARRGPAALSAALGEPGGADASEALDTEHRSAIRHRADLVLALAELERRAAAEADTAASALRAKRVKNLAALHRQRADQTKDAAVALRDLLKALGAMEKTSTAIVNGYAELTGRSPHPGDVGIYLSAVWPRLKVHAATIAPEVARVFGWHTSFSGALPDLIGAERAAAKLYEVDK